MPGFTGIQLLPCPYKSLFGIDCPGCGMQRAFIELLNGNITESILIYPALIPVIFMVLYLGLHLVFNFRKGAIVLKISFIINIIIIFIHYFSKFI